MMWSVKCIQILVAVCMLTGSLGNKVVELTDSNFDSLVGKGKWLVKFYAPWCGHCTRLAPVLRRAAEQKVKGKINIGKVDCTQETALKSRFNINGYPTLQYFEDGKEVSQYNGGRDLDSIAQFAERMSSPFVRPFVSRGAMIEWLEENSAERDVFKEPLSYVLIENKADEEESRAVEEAAKELRPNYLLAVAKSDDTKAWLCAKVKAAGVECSSDRSILIRYEKDETPLVFLGDLTDAQAIQVWIRENSVPVFSEMGMHNYGILTRQRGKKLVVGAFDPSDTRGKIDFLTKLKDMARGRGGLEDDVLETLVFASINGKQWSSFLESYNVDKYELPRTIVLDHANSVFYENKELEQADLAAFLTGAARGTIPSQSAGWMLTLRQTWKSFYNGLPYTGAIAFLVLVVISMFCFMICNAETGDYDPEQEEEEVVDQGKNKDAATKKDPTSKKED